jgi:DNA repair exonuclease SbcCD ATPase subunit
MSYEHEEFDLDRTGYIFVSGLNNNNIDNAKSNGSGKSSLFSAICWCLTGETPNGNKKVENIYLSGETYVELSFESDGKHYVLKRVKNPSNLFINIDGVDKSGKGIRDSEKLLSEYLPEITSSLINSVIILGQGLPKRFTNNSPSGRKEILEKLSNSDFMIEDIKLRVEERKAKLLIDKQQISNNTIKLETQNNILSKDNETLLARLNSMNSSSLELQLENLKLSKKSKESDIYEYNSAIEELTVSLNYHTSLIEELTENYKKEYDVISTQDQDSIDSLISTISSLETKIATKNSEIYKYESVSDTCPTCGQKLPGVTKLDTTELRNECKELKSSLSSYKEELNIKKANKDKAVLELNERYDDSTKDYKSRINKLNSDISNYQSIITKIEDELRSIDRDMIRIETSLSNIDEEKSNILTTIDNNKKLIAQGKQLISDNNEKLYDIDNRLDIVSKMGTFIKRDFRGYLLMNVIDFIYDRIKQYSNIVFGTNDFFFGLDGNNIAISYDGKDYESLSGGEKQKIDIIIQLSIRDMLCNYLNFSSNILVLDEITDSLDVIGSQNVLNLISCTLSDVQSIYIISHHTDFSIPWDEEITIVKGNDKISRIA